MATSARLEKLIAELMEALPNVEAARNYVEWEDEQYQLADAVKDAMPDDWRMPRAKRSAIFHRLQTALSAPLQADLMDYDDDSNHIEMHAMRTGIVIGMALERHQRQRETRKAMQLVPRDTQRARVNSHERRSA